MEERFQIMTVNPFAGIKRRDQELDLLVKPSKEGETVVKHLQVSANWKPAPLQPPSWN
jgi:hypothetical protein